MATVNQMKQFKSGGISFLDKLTQTQLNDMVHAANQQYHAYTSGSTPPSLTDAEFDIVKEYLERKYPEAEALQEIGATLTDKQKVHLPVNMPSMDKIKPDTEALQSWKYKYTGPYVLSCKLDGVSGLYYSLNNTRKLYTRGNGTIGQDISKVLPLLSTIPKNSGMIVRGEFIVSKATFERKYKTQFANIRNMVAGLVNRKKTDPIMRDIDFIAYEVIEPVLKPSAQIEFLQKNGFKTVQHAFKTSSLTNDTLSEILMDWRTNYAYEIDGVIVADDNLHRRTEGNPDHAFAFKMVISDQMVETQVVDVIWNASKDGYLKPRVRVNPVHIGGVTIEYATGFNGLFIESNKIGIGAIVQLVRSGDVIPYIKTITVPAETAKMPDVNYIWTETHVDVLLTNKNEDPVVLEKKITAFFTTLEVDGLSSGNVRRMIQSGYNSIPKILSMRMEDFMTVEGFQEKLSEKISSSIREKITQCSLVRLLVASGCLGRGLGERKIKPIMEAYPDILTSTNRGKIEKLQKINGIGKENAKTFVENIEPCIKFLQDCGLENCLHTSTLTLPESPSTNNTQHDLYQKKIVFTGFRDKTYMEELEKKYQVSFTSAVSKNTFLVVIKDMEETNSKIQQAQKLNIPVMTIVEFKEKYT